MYVKITTRRAATEKGFVSKLRIAFINDGHTVATTGSDFDGDMPEGAAKEMAEHAEALGLRVTIE